MRAPAAPVAVPEPEPEMEVVFTDINDICDDKYPIPDDVLIHPAWEEMVALEPRLAALYEEAKAVKRTRRFCANTVWVRDFKPRLRRLVGYFAEEPRLRDDLAYERAFSKIYYALPDCRGCFCPPAPRSYRRASTA